jgi:hypothetical protein
MFGFQLEFQLIRRSIYRFRSMCYTSLIILYEIKLILTTNLNGNDPNLPILSFCNAKNFGFSGWTGTLAVELLAFELLTLTFGFGSCSDFADSDCSLTLLVTVHPQ